MAVSGVAQTASQDSIGRSSGMPQRVRSRRRRPPRDHSTAATSKPVDTIDSEKSFVPHEYSVHGPEWRALTASSTADLLQTTATHLAPEDVELESQHQQEDDTMAEQGSVQLLPDAELISAGRPLPKGLLTIRPEYSDDLSKITNRSV